MESRLSIELLGPPRIEHGGKPIVVDTRKAIGLLAYLALAPGPQRRSSLAALLWPDSDQAHARTALRRTLAALNKAIGREWLEVDRSAICLPAQPRLFVDVHRFRELLVQGRNSTNSVAGCAGLLPRLEEAVNLYRADFLEGFTLADSPGFDEWQFFQAEGLRRELAQALQNLIHCHGQAQAYEAATTYARRWLALDPLHEAAHQQLIRLYMAQGHQAAAVRQYDECVRLLQEELGVAPAPDTTALYQQVKTTRAAGPVAAQPGAAPAARLGSMATTAIPRLTTSFVGRERELDEIARRLGNADCRLLTLIGPGGVGKSRLALHFAAERADQFSHGITFVPLAPVSSLDFLAPAIAEALRFSFYGPEEPLWQLANFLREKELLLVLDNFEHLLPGADLLAHLLDHAPAVKFLVTSQERLNLQEEWLLEVPGLACPNGNPAHDIESYSAVRLFLERARRVQSGFALADEEKPAVSRICRLVGGTPLGIELASSWVRVLSCREIAQQIETNIDFLETSLRNVPERHRSLRAVFDYSWQLLSAEERTVFRRLSLCRGGFRTAAARAIAGASLPSLMSLADKSFLRRTADGRYEVPEVLSQYGQMKLAQQPQEQEAVQAQHVHYFTAFVWEREAQLKGAGQKEALAELGEEIENIRQAWRWLLALPPEEMAPVVEKAVEAFFLFYELRSWFREGLETMAATAAALAPRRPAAAGSRLWAELLARQASFCFRLSRYAEARELLARSLPILREAGHPDSLAFALYYLGIIEETAGSNDEAHRLQQESLDLYRAGGNDWGMANALNGLGNIALGRGEYEQARAYYGDSLQRRRQIGDRRGIALCLNNLGNLAQVVGNTVEAKQLFRESADLKEELGDERGLALSLNNLGYMATLLQEYDEAEQQLQKSLALFREVGDRRGAAYSLTNLGNVAHDRGQHAAALAIYREALAIFEEINDRVGIAFCLEDLANAAYALGDAQTARAHYRVALETAVAVPAPAVALDVVTSLADLFIDEGQLEKARLLLDQVRRHPASRRQTRDRAEQLQQKIAPPPETAVTPAEPLTLAQLLELAGH
jgi:predicted ATPase/DNA-binding SARP family transcriptional activator